VGGSVALAVAMLAACLLWPGVRAWMEAPKHRFQSRVRDHDRRSAYPDPDGGRLT
jgi:hypothetical protein